jgi:hypothetical protein
LWHGLGVLQQEERRRIAELEKVEMSGYAVLERQRLAELEERDRKARDVGAVATPPRSLSCDSLPCSR